MEFGLQLRHFYTQSNVSLSQRILKRHSMGNGKNHKSIIGIAELSTAHFKCDHVECLAVPLFLGSFIPQVHRLCFLQIWGKWARGRRSIQARQSEWPMTVQNRRKLGKEVKHIITLSLKAHVPFCPHYVPRGRTGQLRAVAHRTNTVTVYHERIWCHNKL